MKLNFQLFVVDYNIKQWVRQQHYWRGSSMASKKHKPFMGLHCCCDYIYSLMLGVLMGFGSCRHECDNTQPFSCALRQQQQQLQVGRKRAWPRTGGTGGRPAALQPTARSLHLCQPSGTCCCFWGFWNKIYLLLFQSSWLQTSPGITRNRAQVQTHTVLVSLERKTRSIWANLKKHRLIWYYLLLLFLIKGYKGHTKSLF